MDLPAARKSFPGLKDRVFLDAACVSLIPTQAEEAVQGLLDEMRTIPYRDASDYHIALDRTRESALHEIGRLINAPVEDIALVESTSHGLNVLAQGLSFRSGDKILMPDIEFIGAAAPWVQMAKSAGVEVKLVPSDGGCIEVDRLIAACDDRTRVICISSVEWCNGYRVDLETLGKFTRRKGIWLIVDAIQHLGTYALDVQRSAIDALVCGGHKWLNAPFGRGLLYLHPGLREHLRPMCWSYLNMRAPDGGWGTFFKTPSISPVADYRFVDTAQNYELGGTTNYVGNVALAASLRMINALGQKVIESHIGILTDSLRTGLNKLGVSIVSPDGPRSRSAITTFSAGSPEANERLLQKLLDHRIQISMRYTAGVGGLRVSTHFFNHPDDIQKLLDKIRELLY